MLTESVPEEDVVDNNRKNSFITRSPTKKMKDHDVNREATSDYSIDDDSEDGVSIIFKT